MLSSKLVSLGLFGLALCAPVQLEKKAAKSAQAGKTIFVVGQNYQKEWNDFQKSFKTPSGISVYGEIFKKELNSDSVSLLKNYAASGQSYVII